jgi:hypothetical protein
MVTPVGVYLGDRFGPFLRMGGVATFEAVFAPEPGTIVLLGAGIAGLAAAGQRRRTRA